MELERARFNMIEQQIRPWDVLDQKVLDLLARIPREDFVPEDYRRLAYADIAVPIGEGEVMMHPKLEGRMLQALDLHPTDVVLEIGTGSGYVTALLAAATHHVYSVEIHPSLQSQATARLAARGVENVTLEVGDAARGWDLHDLRYDVIVLTGSTPVLPDAFPAMLNRGGRLFAVVGESPVMEAVLIRREGEHGHDLSREPLFETELPPLRNAPRPRRFVF
ncbi:MAG TPA: protein-L-isoaspartate O-methyltransferase [Gammaproteobacteria bacterium]|nr:protein-L-isoaspartate O-methyltransferase [Gammaproteobacteria bacterium]